jgi:hypothetical protein
MNEVVEIELDVKGWFVIVDENNNPVGIMKYSAHASEFAGMNPEYKVLDTPVREK